MHEHFVIVTKKPNYAILWEKTFPLQKTINNLIAYTYIILVLLFQRNWDFRPRKQYLKFNFLLWATKIIEWR